MSSSGMSSDGADLALALASDVDRASLRSNLTLSTMWSAPTNRSIVSPDWTPSSSRAHSPITYDLAEHIHVPARQNGSLDDTRPAVGKSAHATCAEQVTELEWRISDFINRKCPLDEGVALQLELQEWLVHHKSHVHSEAMSILLTEGLLREIIAKGNIYPKSKADPAAAERNSLELQVRRNFYNTGVSSLKSKTMSHDNNITTSNNPHQHAHRETVTAVPSMTIDGDHVIIGDAHSYSERSWTQVKVVGRGSSSSVCLVDWHSRLPPGTHLSPMQCGAGARPEWNGKVLVTLKKMTKPCDDGWEEHKELQSLRSIPQHDNIISLYDLFLTPLTKQLFLVYESMEGNVHQLIRSRKGRAFVPGLVFSIFQQVVSGLHHIHSNGYIHRDVKPKNLLVTTIGLADYAPMTPQDLMVIIKIADFGFARETSSRPPTADYFAARWHRAPEVLLRAREYSNSIDMWALGTILAELINLKPLFPGLGEIDQMSRITQVLGEPTDSYGYNGRGRIHGGGPWPKGIEMADSYGVLFGKSEPIVFTTLFAPTVPRSLVDVIEDLLRYEPAARLKTSDLLDCEYVREMRSQPVPVPRTPLAVPPLINDVRGSSKKPTSTSTPPLSPCNVMPSHLQSPLVDYLFSANSSESSDSTDTQRPSYYSGSQLATSIPEDLELPGDYKPSPPNARERSDHMQALSSLMPLSTYSFAGDRLISKQDCSVTTADEVDNVNATHSGYHPLPHPLPRLQQPPSHSKKRGMTGSNGFRKPLMRLLGGSGKPNEDLLSVPGATQTQSSSSWPNGPSTPLPHSLSAEKMQMILREAVDPKRLRKEAQLKARAGEKVRRAIERRWQRDQARAVMQKRHLMLKASSYDREVDWQKSVLSHLNASAAASSRQLQHNPVQVVDPTPAAVAVRLYSDDSIPHQGKFRQRETENDYSSFDFGSNYGASGETPVRRGRRLSSATSSDRSPSPVL